ncbi:TetR/AcrR family transcriptional regulator [Paenibacillus barcinonensis]|uniref:TetR family transcriptional regulator n=1 Tax=Paenibacillus barcinonensis TaxID=198119 RepID=A0A2V4W662_PAEBA|nr:TetR/AcrR family transcriptional regulator [Paenibacillus barcinonensis]PYE50307.1 TetR family transcriptional regulator [Paenibacillus barcinonensis]QKS54987.1 TetR/AcrR family transcriptional regulator [Paenibacillus barcinonensis]
MSEKSNARDLIIGTAARLFFSQGYHATGLNQIIKESNTPKGSLYHYFPQGKEELALECIQTTNAYVLQKFQETFQSYETTSEGIRQFIYETANEAEASGYTGFYPFSFWAAVETSCISQQLRAASQDVFAGWQEVIACHLIQDGIGEERARETAMLVVSLMEGALIISLTNQDKQPLLTAADYLSVVAKNAEQKQ